MVVWPLIFWCSCSFVFVRLTALVRAHAGHLSCVNLLLAEGADIEQRNVVRRNLMN